MDPPVKLKTPSRPLSITQKSVTRSSSVRSKGINFNTVSPTPGLINSNASGDLPARTSHRVQRESSRENGSPGPATMALIERPLPSAKELRALSMDDQLRLLASKEMAVVAINDSINNLKRKLESTQGELHQLRSLISKSLSRQVHSQKEVQNRRESAHGVAGSSKPKSKEDSSTHDNAPTDHSSTLWSNLSKPISFIQQLDSIIQNEMEKSLAPHGPRRNIEHKLAQPHPKQNIKNKEQITHSDLDKDDEALPVNLDRYLPPTHEPKYMNTDDMFQAVSSSLWSFVSEVKNNMVSTLTEAQDDETLHEKAPAEGDDDSLLSLTEATEPSFSTEESDDERDHLDLSIYSSMRQSNQK